MGRPPGASRLQPQVRVRALGLTGQHGALTGSDARQAHADAFRGRKGRHNVPHLRARPRARPGVVRRGQPPLAFHHSLLTRTCARANRCSPHNRPFPARRAAPHNAQEFLVERSARSVVSGMPPPAAHLLPGTSSAGLPATSSLLDAHHLQQHSSHPHAPTHHHHHHHQQSTSSSNQQQQVMASSISSSAGVASSGAATGGVGVKRPGLLETSLDESAMSVGGGSSTAESPTGAGGSLSPTKRAAEAALGANNNGKVSRGRKRFVEKGKPFDFRRGRGLLRASTPSSPYCSTSPRSGRCRAWCWTRTRPTRSATLPRWARAAPRAPTTTPFSPPAPAAAARRTAARPAPRSSSSSRARRWRGCPAARCARRSRRWQSRACRGSARAARTPLGSRCRRAR